MTENVTSWKVIQYHTCNLLLIMMTRLLPVFNIRPCIRSLDKKLKVLLSFEDSLTTCVYDV